MIALYLHSELSPNFPALPGRPLPPHRLAPLPSRVHLRLARAGDACGAPRARRRQRRAGCHLQPAPGGQHARRFRDRSPRPPLPPRGDHRCSCGRAAVSPRAGHSQPGGCSSQMPGPGRRAAVSRRMKGSVGGRREKLQGAPKAQPGHDFTCAQDGESEAEFLPDDFEEKTEREKKHANFTLCNVCNIQLNSATQAQIHYNGKSHQKRLKQLSNGMLKNDNENQDSKFTSPITTTASGVRLLEPSTRSATHYLMFGELIRHSELQLSYP
ncbi:uncharacterized protein LOC131411502 [Diceros bicornis minor]|uniref:uncharacterized protein LOC131411502 n=1 Tax=Diceros bicornis minor TaxID=77932 RepID=UPI0026ECD030|nr:uncharacterized protein LOC131411502 [Diceros bicornis minor]